MVEISYKNYAFISKKEENYELRVLKDQSEIVIHGPEEIKNFKKFINFPNASLFAVQYENKGHKLLILDSNFNRKNRGVELVDLGCESAPSVSVNNFSDF